MFIFILSGKNIGRQTATRIHEQKACGNGLISILRHELPELFLALFQKRLKTILDFAFRSRVPLIFIRGTSLEEPLHEAVITLHSSK